MQGRDGIECNVIGRETINWEDAATLVGSLLSGTFPDWAESEINGQINQFEKNGLTVRSGHSISPQSSTDAFQPWRSAGFTCMPW